MPLHFSGTIEQRYAKLDEAGRRCDANGRRCPGTAVERFELLPTDGFGHIKPNAVPVIRQSCSRHRLQFCQGGTWHLVSRHALGPTDSQRRRVA